MLPNQEMMSGFIRNDFFNHLNSLSADAPANWGKMNVQQMIEHLVDFVGLSYEKIKFPLCVPEDMVEKYQAFLFSEKMFRENTKAPAQVMPEEPVPTRCAGIAEATDELKSAIEEFFSFFMDNPERKTLHPAFGWLDHSGWMILHYKHFHHHLRQFGCIV
jgi:hypothetical protein